MIPIAYNGGHLLLTAVAARVQPALPAWLSRYSMRLPSLLALRAPYLAFRSPERPRAPAEDMRSPTLSRVSTTGIAFDTALLLPYFVVMIVLAIYGIHRYTMCYLYFKYRKNYNPIPPAF